MLQDGALLDPKVTDKPFAARVDVLDEPWRK
jgi:hypothetical protein